MSQPLSARQKEALLWTARGKTLGETGEIMGVKWTSVRYHLDIAKLKLQAVGGSAHVVAMAIAKHEISLDEIFEAKD